METQEAPGKTRKVGPVRPYLTWIVKNAEELPGIVEAIFDKLEYLHVTCTLGVNADVSNQIALTLIDEELPKVYPAEFIEGFEILRTFSIG